MSTKQQYEVTTVAELEEEPQRATVDGQKFLLYMNDEREVFAYRNLCPHQGGPVATGRLQVRDGRDQVICPWHGWEFDLDGGENPFEKPEFAGELHQIETTVEDGTVYIHL